ncbi:branched-chain amino acid transport system II carrier protein [Gelria sp. Kuro-4]|uniref:branched-chain amino acid transport system II carrier protein n=1 Tax=Gelria sp. Kuro-4 TaxID=2796927 RepID=UPI001BED66DE|nr:branched-chain amino acid transport system II carrier protein [Gelria sp. Kuro-4]BCV23745.1 branched-chain amino acid transport system carrier protein [Gelria sp. Kuro-4]
MRKLQQDHLVVGFALFAMFFGAGNLIFPPYLGLLTGSRSVPALIGFLISGIGLPLLGVMACGQIGGTFIHMSARVGKGFSLAATSALILAIGPALAIPRTAATTYELAVQPLLPSVPPLLSAGFFFLVTALFVLKPSNIVDNVGRILTPGLLFVLAVIIMRGLLVPIGPVVDTGFAQPFAYALREGYQTMDAMAAVIFAGIILSAARDRGYTGGEVKRLVLGAGLVAATGLAFVYGGLIYLGSQASTFFRADVPRTALFLAIARRELGAVGGVVLALAVALACLTTAIGLMSAGASFFSKYIFRERVSYRSLVIAMSLVSALIASSGVKEIVALAVPVLTVLYPVVITLIALTLMGDWAGEVASWRSATYTALVVSTLETLGSLTRSPLLQTLLGFLPFAASGFAWVLPTVAAFLVGQAYGWLQRKELASDTAESRLR